VGTGPGVGEVDAAVGFHHHVIGAVQPASLEAAGDDRYAAVGFQTGDAAAIVFRGHQPALEVTGEAVGPVRGLAVDDSAPARSVLHPPVVMDVAKQQVTALFPPERSFSGALVSTEAIGQLQDRLVGGNDLG